MAQLLNFGLSFNRDPSSPEGQLGKPTYLHLPESGLVIMAPGKAGGCLTPLQGFFYFFGCQEHLDIHKVLRGRGSSGHNMPVAYKQGQLISTLFTPASQPEFWLGPTASLPPVQPVWGTAHREYPGNRLQEQKWSVMTGKLTCGRCLLVRGTRPILL